MGLAGAWTGGQYSVVRALVGATAACFLAQAAFAEGGPVPLPFLPLLVAVVAAIAVTLGAAGRPAAVVAAAALLWSGGGAAPPATTFLVGAWLLAHCLVPAAPYGSLAARGRENPGGGWAMPAAVAGAWWLVFVAARTAAGASALASGSLASGFALLWIAALALRVRSGALAWTLSLGFDAVMVWQGVLPASTVFVLHLVAMQPAWIPPRSSNGRDVVFYDGGCALCHGFVRFLLAEDRTQPPLRIAPLGSPLFSSLLAEADRDALPDSVVFLHEGRPLLRSAAVLALLDALGGLWWIVATVARVVPRRLADAAYDVLAARRKTWFGTPVDSCPVLPLSLRARIEDGKAAPAQPGAAPLARSAPAELATETTGA